MALEMCFGIAAADRLSGQRRGDHPAGHPRHHPDQPLPARGPSRCGSSCTSRRSSRSRSRIASRSRSGCRFPACTARRRISTCSCSAAPRPWSARWWRRSASRSISCDSCRAIAARRSCPGGLRMLSAGPGWIVVGALKLLAGSFLAYFALSHGVTAEHAAEPTEMYLTAFQLCAVAAGPRAGADRHFRDPVAAQDQRHQRLCRLDRVVEFFLAADAQPSRPRRVAGVQRAGRRCC